MTKRLRKIVWLPVLAFFGVVLVGCDNDNAPQKTDFTITFDSNGGSSVSSIVKEEGFKVSKPTDPNKIYVNGTTEIFKVKNVGGFSTKTLSRRYDIEFRTQYFYYLNGEVIESIAVEVPMLFVQEKQLDALATDITSSNSGVVSSFSLNVDKAVQTKILSDYATLIDPFILRKNEFTSQEEINYPRTQNYDGYKHPFYSYLEAIYSSMPNPKLSFVDAVNRCNSNKRFTPIQGIHYSII